MRFLIKIPQLFFKNLKIPYDSPNCWIGWYILGKYILSTEEYVHCGTNVFDYVPHVVRNDSDLLQLYTICRYFERRNSSLREVNAKIEQSVDKGDFLLWRKMLERSCCMHKNDNKQKNIQWFTMF